MPCPRLPVVCLALLCLFPSRARGTEYQDYRIPDHHWSAWSANLSGSGDRQQSTIDPDSRNTHGIFFLSGQSRILWGRDSDREQHNLSFEAGGVGARRNSFSTAGAPVSGESRDRVRNLDESLSLFAGWTLYPTGRPFGFSASGTFQSQYDQSWQARGNRSIAPPTELRSASDSHFNRTRYVSSASFGPVLGRVRDATPVLDARTLEDRLAKAGSLARPLSAEARQRIAQLLAMRGRVRYAHERPERWFWREVERVLQEDSALGPQGLDAFAVLRLLEEVNPSTAPRFVGRSLRVFVTLNASREHASSAGSNSSTTLDNGTVVNYSTSSNGSDGRARSDFAGVGYQADYHRPLGGRGQIDASEQMVWFDRPSVLQLGHQLRASWSVTDRWSLSSQWAALAQSQDRRGSRKFGDWTFSHVARAQYRLEDAWSLSLSWEDFQAHSANRFNREDRLTIGVGYQFLGHLTAPGIIEPMRLEPARP